MGEPNSTMGKCAKLLDGRGDERAAVLAGLCCCVFAGVTIFLSIFFTLGADNIDDMDYIVETTCNFQSLQDNPYWLCQSQDVDCSGYGCNAPANANGDCSAWLTASTAAGSATTAGSITPCCDGPTAYPQSQCQANVACNTGHRYDSELDFTIDGVTFNVTHHAACGLTSAGYEDTACMAEVHAKYNGVADVSCWVDKRLLPECGAAGTTNTCVSYSAPEWDMGCWAGVVIGGVMMLLGGIFFCIFLTGSCKCKDEYGNAVCGEIWIDIMGMKYVYNNLHHDEFAAAQRAYQEKCAALQKQLDDEKKSQSTDGLIVKISDDSGKKASLTTVGSHSVSMVCKQLGVVAFSFAQTEYDQGSSKTLRTIGICNDAMLKVASLPAGTSSQVTIQSQLQVELERMKEWDEPQKEGYEYTKATKTCCGIPCCSTYSDRREPKFKQAQSSPSHPTAQFADNDVNIQL